MFFPAADGAPDHPEAAENLAPAAGVPLESLFNSAAVASQRRFSAAC
jgi:hypothetical protein